ncbi:hypothetical protein P9112_009976 [Eukaryota sp. TZLM1-RC]
MRGERKVGIINIINTRGVGSQHERRTIKQLKFSARRCGPKVSLLIISQLSDQNNCESIEVEYESSSSLSSYPSKKVTDLQTDDICLTVTPQLHDQNNCESIYLNYMSNLRQSKAAPLETIETATADTRDFNML